MTNTFPPHELRHIKFYEFNRLLKMRSLGTLRNDQQTKPCERRHCDAVY